MPNFKFYITPWKQPIATYTSPSLEQLLKDAITEPNILGSDMERDLHNSLYSLRQWFIAEEVAIFYPKTDPCEINHCVILQFNPTNPENLTTLIDGFTSQNPKEIFRTIFDSCYAQLEHCRRFVKALEQQRQILLTITQDLNLSPLTQAISALTPENCPYLPTTSGSNIVEKVKALASYNISSDTLFSSVLNNLKPIEALYCQEKQAFEFLLMRKLLAAQYYLEHRSTENLDRRLNDGKDRDSTQISPLSRRRLTLFATPQSQSTEPTADQIERVSSPTMV